MLDWCRETVLQLSPNWRQDFEQKNLWVRRVVPSPLWNWLCFFVVSLRDVVCSVFPTDTMMFYLNVYSDALINHLFSRLTIQNLPAYVAFYSCGEVMFTIVGIGRFSWGGRDIGRPGNRPMLGVGPGRGVPVRGWGVRGKAPEADAFSDHRTRVLGVI